MSIVTKTGDDGSTALMYGRRVPKNHPRVETYGTVDELNAALGLARATAKDNFIRDPLPTIQNDLVTLMGELAVAVGRFAAICERRLFGRGTGDDGKTRRARPGN